MHLCAKLGKEEEEGKKSWESILLCLHAYYLDKMASTRETNRCSVSVRSKNSTTRVVSPNNLEKLTNADPQEWKNYFNFKTIRPLFTAPLLTDEAD